VYNDESWSLVTSSTFLKPFILEVKPMSTPTAPQEQKKIHHVIMHHAKQPHGIALIALALFVAAWIMWTFVVW
jgi:hypothetical protein